MIAALLRAEVRKLACSPAWWVLALLAVLVTAGASSDPTAGSLAIHLAVILEWVPAVCAALFGALCVTTEYQHYSIARSYLIAADRPWLTAAKAMLAAVVGAGYAAICAAAAVATFMLWHVQVGPELGSLVQVGLAGVGVGAAWGVLGVGLGTLTPRRLPAMLLAALGPTLLQIGWWLLEWRLGNPQLASVHYYLPLGATEQAVEVLSGEQSDARFSFETQPWWLMLLVLAGYAVLLVGAGTARAQRRDLD